MAKRIQPKLSRDAGDVISSALTGAALQAAERTLQRLYMAESTIVPSHAEWKDKAKQSARDLLDYTALLSGKAEDFIQTICERHEDLRPFVEPSLALIAEMRAA